MGIKKSKSPFLNKVRERIRVMRYSIRTEEAYVGWIKRYILFHGKKHPSELRKEDMERFLTNLAVKGKVSASTRNQALSALVFMYRHILEIDPPWVENVVRGKPGKNLPVVLSRNEVVALLDKVPSNHSLIIRLLYVTGLRLMESVRLRVKDIDFADKAITVRDGKGGKDRIVMLPDSLSESLGEHLKKRESLYKSDLEEGFVVFSLMLVYILARLFLLLAYDQPLAKDNLKSLILEPIS